MGVARVGCFERQPAHARLQCNVQDLRDRHVVDVRAGKVAPAQMQSQTLTRQAFQCVVEHLNVQARHVAELVLG